MVLNQPNATEIPPATALARLRSWMEDRDFRGFEPYDVLNSPYMQRKWLRQPPLSFLLIQSAKRFGGMPLRRFLKVPASKNPKAIALALHAYCDMARAGQEVSEQARSLKEELKRLRSPGERDFCWGYDWDFMSWRGTSLPAFSPNCIASYFAGVALLEMSELFGDAEAREMARSVSRFFTTRLNHSVDTPEHLCLSYTPHDHTRIFNNSVLAGAFLARIGTLEGDAACLSLARRAMAFLCAHQLPDGGWFYGMRRRQRWIDGFHTSYNVLALFDYERATGDRSFIAYSEKGHRYYKRTFLTVNGAPKYFHNHLYPIDIHSCSQAMLHFCAFASRDDEALALALRTYSWTMNNMAAADGAFYYQRHRFWTDKTLYMRWGQAWMLRSLARMVLTSAGNTND